MTLEKTLQVFGCGAKTSRSYLTCSSPALSPQIGWSSLETGMYFLFFLAQGCVKVLLKEKSRQGCGLVTVPLFRAQLGQPWGKSDLVLKYGGAVKSGGSLEGQGQGKHCTEIREGCPELSFSTTDSSGGALKVSFFRVLGPLCFCLPGGMTWLLQETPLANCTVLPGRRTQTLEPGPAAYWLLELGLISNCFRRRLCPRGLMAFWRACFLGMDIGIFNGKRNSKPGSLYQQLLGSWVSSLSCMTFLDSIPHQN